MVANLSLQLLTPFIEAQRLANPGVDLMQARSFFYWQIATHYEFDPKPMALLLNSLGGGKTTLVKAAIPFLSIPKWIEGNTYVRVRDELSYQCKTAIFDERDEGIDVVPEDLLRKRWEQSTSLISVNKRAHNWGDWEAVHLNINGWTLVARRYPFRDVALMSRCLIVRPEHLEDPNSITTEFPPEPLAEIISQLGDVDLTPTRGNRAAQVWHPLAVLAGRFGDGEWLERLPDYLSSGQAEHRMSRQYEPEEAVINAFEICKNSPDVVRLFDHWIKISDVRRTANGEFESNLSPAQMATILHRAGKEVGVRDGYPVVRVEDDV